jgi:uncharacterized protein YaaW (UPF0174 family)
MTYFVVGNFGNGISQGIIKLKNEIVSQEHTTKLPERMMLRFLIHQVDKLLKGEKKLPLMKIDFLSFAVLNL